MVAGFTCKQFFVAHQQCAMKVGTDSLVLGAWAHVPSQGDMLDIGCGSAILSLMLAQRTSPEQHIDAVELCPLAAAEAQQNVANSPWPRRIRVIQRDILTYPDSADHLGSKRYALIISNPPYFEHSLKNLSQQRQLARHTDSLAFADLLAVTAQLASEQGQFCLILPSAAAEDFSALAAQFGWYLVQSCDLQSAPHKVVERRLMRFSRTQLLSPATESRLLVREADGNYSAAYRQLLRDFYLKF